MFHSVEGQTQTSDCQSIPSDGILGLWDVWSDHREITDKNEEADGISSSSNLIPQVFYHYYHIQSYDLLCLNCIIFHHQISWSFKAAWFDKVMILLLQNLQVIKIYKTISHRFREIWWQDVSPLPTVYPKKYAHGFVVLCFVVVMQSFIMSSYEVFIHIHQDCFAGTGAIVRLPQCQWSKPDGYGKIIQCITTTMHSKAKKTVCIFLGYAVVARGPDLYDCIITCLNQKLNKLQS